VGTIPDDHFDVDENPDNRDKDKEVANVVDALIIEHHFAKNYGTCHIISELCHRNIPVVRFLLRSCWKTGCITFGSINLGIIMKSVL
jgi:hypothetical protein